MTTVGEVRRQAMAKLEQGQLREAEAMFERLLEELPTDSEARFGLGLSRFRLKDYALSERTLLTLTKEAPNHYMGWYYLGLSQERLGQHTEAIESYRRSMAANPSFAKAAEKLSTLQPEPKPSDSSTRVPVAKAIDSGLGNAALSSGRLDAGQLVLHTNRRISSFTGTWVLMFLSVLFWLFLLTVASGSPVPKEILLISVGVPTLLLLSLLLRSRATVYKIYESRIDVEKGVLFRKSDSVWMYDIEDVQYSQDPLESLTRNATITVDSARGSVGGKPERMEMKGLESASAARARWEWIRDRAVIERRAMKGIWT